MQTALASRTGALEKVVLELRGTNANLVQAREGLDRAERLAMVGSLAAGVAHEVGNPMGALLAFLDLVGRDPGLGEAGRHSLERASQQGERVRVILRQLLDFSRPPRVEHGPVALEGVAHQVVQLVSAQPEFSDIEFDVQVEKEVPNALGDESLVSQILLNLTLNAAAAMRNSPIRKIRFEIAKSVRHRRAGELEEDASSHRTDSVVCRIGDSGSGVGLNDPERIFDPFFTTKAPGEGTGLGLANARRLAGEMGGTLELDPQGSEWGGALFCFLLSAELDTPSDSPGVGTREPRQSRMP
jgi:signal transduction histidine kinase